MQQSQEENNNFRSAFEPLQAAPNPVATPTISSTKEP